MFRLTDEQQAIRDAVRTFAQEEIRPVARHHDEHKEYPADLVQEAADLDFVAPSVPPEYGGAGMDTIETCIVTEELWRGDPGIGSAIGSRGFGTQMIKAFGDEWMKEEWLPKVTSGESATASAISEPAHGSNVAGMDTRAEKREARSASERSGAAAEKDGDEYVINGNKMWITNGTVADVAVVMAKTDPGEGKHGISAILVPLDADGVTREKIDNKLGIRASDLAELVFDDVRVPEDHLIGTENEGFYQLMAFFAEGRVGVASQAVGAAQAALDAALDYAGEREQFGQPISEFQAIEHKLAEMATVVEAARSLTYRAAAQVEAGNDAQAAQYASMAKLFASERAVEVADEAIQVHGGAGYVTDHPVERYYRDARITKIYEGTSEIQKNIIADNLL